jgi:hypothetical protein
LTIAVLSAHIEPECAAFSTLQPEVNEMFIEKKDSITVINDLKTFINGSVKA